MEISEVERTRCGQGMDGTSGGTANKDSKELWIKDGERQCSKEARAGAWAKVLALMLATV